MRFKLPTKTELALFMYSDRFQIQPGARQVDGAQCWSLMDTELNLVVEAYGGWSAEEAAGRAAIMANTTARSRSIVSVPPAFNPLGYARNNTWCLVCGTWGINRTPSCSCLRLNRDISLTHGQVQQLNRDRILVAVAHGGLYSTAEVEPDTVAWRAGCKTAAASTRMHTLLKHGLLTAKDGHNWYNRKPCKQQWTLTAAGAKRVREIVAAERAAQAAFAEKIRAARTEAMALAA